jgi:hypothetical protein
MLCGGKKNVVKNIDHVDAQLDSGKMPGVDADQVTGNKTHVHQQDPIASGP